MNIKGLDYNTTREKLVMPEYGREVQNMVSYAMTLPDRRARQRCAEGIVAIMARMMQRSQKDANFRQKLWDHLALMSDFKLDIDYPVDVRHARAVTARPQPVPYPMSRIPVRHYGKMLFEMFDRLKTMPAGRERDELARLAANHMKRNLMQWGRGSFDKHKVADDLARYTDGRVQLDIDHFVFEKTPVKEQQATPRRRKK